MPFTYTSWPSTTQLATLLAELGSTVTVGADIGDAYLSASIARLERETQRQFISGSAGEVRYYNGSGTGILLIDDYIDVSEVEFIDYNPALASFSLSGFYEIDRKGFPKNKIYINQGAPTYILGGRNWSGKFPEGRANIKVTGQFGYGTSIPQDVWMAVLQNAGAMALNPKGVTPDGRIQAWSEADVSEKYGIGEDGTPAGAAGWADALDRIIKSVKKPTSPRIQNRKAPLW